MPKLALTLEEAFEIRAALEKLETSSTKLPLPFSYPLMRNKRVLDRAFKDYQKASRKTPSAVELERFNQEQVELLDEHLKKDHLGNYAVEGEGNEKRNVPKDPVAFQKAMDAFWARWSNRRQLQLERQREDLEYLEQPFDTDLYTIKFSAIPTNLEPEYIKAILPLIIDLPDELPTTVEPDNSDSVSESKEAA